MAAPSPAYYSTLFLKENDLTAIARYLLWIPKDLGERPALLLRDPGRPLNNCANTGWSPAWCA